MSYTLENFCADTRDILAKHNDADGREQVRQKFESLLANEDFCAAHVGADSELGMMQIYEDPEAHFCILAYNMGQARTSPPHDHGSSWAIYGQTAGHTDMTVWSQPGTRPIEPVKTFRLDPGQAGLFDVREIHSIDYAAGAKFVRVTGVDMSNETRRVFDPDTGEAREVEHVGTGSAR
jgi:predicted metal-dependent enzyme (double-stranded beta helix superfamily)